MSVDKFFNDKFSSNVYAETEPIDFGYRPIGSMTPECATDLISDNTMFAGVTSDELHDAIAAVLDPIKVDVRIGIDAYLNELYDDILNKRPFISTPSVSATVRETAVSLPPAITTADEIGLLPSPFLLSALV